MKRLTTLAMALVLGAATSVAYAEGSDSGAGAGSGDSGDNSMAVRAGDSWFALQAGEAARTPVVDVRIAVPSAVDAQLTSQLARNPFRDDTAA